MAGKVWSAEEEAYFWLHVIPFSRHRRGADIMNPELSFQQLGERMQAALGQKARRQYTALCLGGLPFCQGITLLEANTSRRGAFLPAYGGSPTPQCCPGMGQKV